MFAHAILSNDNESYACGHLLAILIQHNGKKPMHFALNM